MENFFRIFPIFGLYRPRFRNGYEPPFWEYEPPSPPAPLPRAGEGRYERRPAREITLTGGGLSAIGPINVREVGNREEQRLGAVAGVALGRQGPIELFGEREARQG